MSALQQILMEVGGGTASGGLNPLWSNVVLALHGDGANGTTTIVDEKGRASPTGNRGTSAISSAQSRFGGSSIRFNCDGGLIYSTGVNTVAFRFPGDFMIRMWLWLDASAHTGVARVIYDCRNSGGDQYGFVFFVNASGGLSLYTATVYLLNDTTTAFPTNQWVHVALARQGPTMRVFLNGALYSSFAAAYDWTNGRCCVGDVNPEYQATTAFYGFIDDFEIASGQAVYTAAYTPPTVPFPNS